MLQDCAKKCDLVARVSKVEIELNAWIAFGCPTGVGFFVVKVFKDRHGLTLIDSLA